MSVTVPPASSTIKAPAAWSQIFSRYARSGKRMKIEASPRESAPLLEGLLSRESTVVPGVAKRRYAVLHR